MVQSKKNVLFAQSHVLFAQGPLRFKHKGVMIPLKNMRGGASMKKRILSMLLALMMCLSLLPTAALAAEGESSGTPTLGETLTLEAVASDPYGYDGEGRQKLTDGDTGTKWCFTFPSGGAYVILKADSAVTISGYSFTTGNDNATETGRNPKSWTLYGSDSQDGSWTVIDSVTDDTTIQDQNFAKFDFVLTTVPSAYQYYKFAFTANQGAKVMQLSEIALYGAVCEHEWQNEGDPVAVTCTTDGYRLQKCSKCSSTQRVNVVRAKGHNYENGTCTVCHQVCCAALTTAGNDVYYFENIKDALDKAQGYDGCTIKLYSKATYDKQFDAIRSTFTIDLNGQQAAFRLMISYGSNITLINTAEKQAIFGDDSIDDPVVYAHDGMVTVGRSDGSDGDIRFRSKDNTGSSNETFKIYKYSKPSLYGGSYMGITCDESAKLYDYLPAGFAFADSSNNEVAATGNTLSEVHIVPHIEHQYNDNGFCPICGACQHKNAGGASQCPVCGKEAQASIEQGENVTYFFDLNEAIQKATETTDCTLKLLADAGTLTVSKGTFTLDLNGNTADSLTVSGGSIKLANAKGIGTLTVSGDVTLASLLPEGYAFYAWYHWYSTDELAETTSLSNITVRQIPLKNLQISADKESYVYGNDITLTANFEVVSDSTFATRYYWQEGETFLHNEDNEDSDNPLVIKKPTAGEHTYTYTFETSDGYSLSQSITVNVTSKSITGAKVTLEQDSFEYDGTAKKPTVSEVKLGETTLTSDDYDVTVTPQTNVGSGYTVTVTGKGNYTGTASASWSITTKTVENPTIELSGTSFPYDNGNEIKPTVIVKDGETTISTDEYTVAYTNNINVGTATVTVTDKDGGNYTVNGSTSFTIDRASFTAPTVTMRDYTYGGTLPTPSIGTYPGGGTVTYYYNTTNSSSGGTEWKDMTATSLSVGTYYLYAVIAESQNHMSVTTATAEFKVSAAAAPVTVWPTVSGTVYVNDEALTDAHLTGGAADVDGTFTITDTTKTWAESGEKQLKVTFTPTDNNYSAVEQSITVTVCKRTVTAVAEQTDITGKPFLTEQNELGLPDTVSITADGKQFTVSVTWSGYNKDTLDEQTLTGALDLTAISAEVQQPETALTASIKVKLNAITLPAVTFADKTATYTGKPIANTLTAPTGVATVKYEYKGKDSTVYEKSEMAPTDAGTYTVTATFTMDYGYNQLASVSSTLTINKASFAAPAVTMRGYTYGDTPSTPSISTYPGGGAVTYYYSTTNSSSGGVEWKDMTATSLNVGTYYMYAVIAESQNYTSVTTQPVKFTVSAAAAPVTVWPTVSGTVYVNDAGLTNDRLTGGTADVDGSFTITDTTKTWTESGEKQLMVTFTPESSNYSAVEGEITVSVVKRTVTAVAEQTAITGKIFLTEQSELGLPDTVSITAGGKQFTVPVTWSGYNKNTLDEQTLTGTLDLTAISAEVQQPETARTASIKVKLTAITLPAVTFADKTETYTGEPIANTLTAPTGVASVKYEYEGKSGTVYEKSETAPVDVGSYTVTATFAMDYGYSQLAPVSSILTINKAGGSVSAPAARTDLVYNGEAQALIIAGSSTTGTIQYKLNNGEYSTALPEATNAGTYTVSYKVVGDKNHEDVAEKSISVTIAKKPIPAPVADETVFTYNGEKQAYKLEESVDYSISDNVTQTNANEEGYTVTVSLKDKANTVWADTENDTEDKTYQFIIHKAKATVTAKDKTAYVGSAAPDLSKPVQDKDYTIEGLFGEDTLGGTIKLDYAETPNMQKTGTVQINVSGADGGQNYTVSYVPGTLTIKTRPVSGAPTYPVELPGKTENGTVSVSPKNAASGSTVTITVKPDSGYTLETITVTDKDGNELKLTNKGNGQYTFIMPASKVVVKVTFMEDNSLLNFFYDVPNNAYYFDAVKWAVENGITGGVGGNLFAPNGDCTRAQIVTFLWRAAGAPAAAAGSFADVSTGSYYADAVAWAVTNGVTGGTGNGLFSPDAVCTRAQAVTFLWRAAGSPEPRSMSTFTDVPADAYYAKAVAWAVENGITTGTRNGKFSPDDTCTRAQIVTFLFRAYQDQ